MSLGNQKPRAAKPFGQRLRSTHLKTNSVDKITWIVHLGTRQAKPMERSS
jgi:hypothetical protein